MKKKDEFYLKEFKPKTKNQNELIRAIAENEIIFVTGYPGTGKTFLSTCLACEYYFYKKVDNIVITRPLVEAGNSSPGTLPGDTLQKCLPYIYPVLSNIEEIFGKDKVQTMLRLGDIRIVPPCFLRGLTFNNTFVIADEMSNATFAEMKLLLTRIGKNSKMVINGDLKQSDLKLDQQGALKHAITKLNNIPGIGIVQLYEQDIVRNPLISKILSVW